MSEPALVRCDGCGSEIDPETCNCGDTITHSAWDAGHTPVPMGCCCFYPKDKDE